MSDGANTQRSRPATMGALWAGAPLRRRLATVLGRLPIQVVLLMSLALFPLGLISLYQTGQVIAEARDLNRTSLMERTVAAGADERDLMQRAFGAAQGLGMAVLSVPIAECENVLTRFVAANPTFLSARYYGQDGRIICRSRGSDPLALPDPGVDLQVASIQPARDERGVAVLRVKQPIESDGALQGRVSISIPLQLANALISGGDPRSDMRIAVINAAGEVLAASHGLDAAPTSLPRNRATTELFAMQGLTFDGTSADGKDRVFAVATMIEGRAAMIGSWPRAAVIGGPLGLPSLAPMVLPVLMWFTGMLVAYFGLQRLVVRHVTSLRTAMRQFAMGELRGGRVQLDHAPEELREAERSFNRMVVMLAQAEAKQEQDLRDKEVLLREVHHRVKNNLQLIASIMNMHARGTDSPEARRILDSLRTRVRGLATVHRTLYSTPQMTTVDAATLIEALVKDITGVADDPGLRVETALSSVTLYPDQAVPLSMLLSETVTNAVKYTRAPDAGAGAGLLRVVLTHDDQDITLVVENTVSGPDDAAQPESGDRLGTRLIAAFEQQLGARSEVVRDGGRYRYTVRFQKREFEATP